MGIYVEAEARVTPHFVASTALVFISVAHTQLAKLQHIENAVSDDVKEREGRPAASTSPLSSAAPAGGAFTQEPKAGRMWGSSKPPPKSTSSAAPKPPSGSPEESPSESPPMMTASKTVSPTGGDSRLEPSATRFRHRQQPKESEHPLPSPGSTLKAPPEEFKKERLLRYFVQV